jgi:hypothetical protein
MNDTITVGSAAYKAILYRVNWLDDQCSRRQLTVQENSELKRERGKLEAAELAHNAAAQGAVE